MIIEWRKIFSRLLCRDLLTVVKVVDQYCESWDLWRFRKRLIQFWPTHAVGSLVRSRSMQLARMAAHCGISGKPHFAVSIKYWTMMASSSVVRFRRCAEDWDFVIPPSIHDLRVPWQQSCFLARKVGVRGDSALSPAVYSSYASFVRFWCSWNSCCLSAWHLAGVFLWRGKILLSQSCGHHCLYVPQAATDYTKYIK